MTKTENIKLHINRLSFEMTRQCNLACAHCARGEAQNAVIKREYIDRVLDQIDYVYDCIKRWNARYPLYEEESKELYRTPMTYVANGMVDDAGTVAARQMTFGLIEMRQQIQKTAPQIPFSVIADATYEPYKKAITGQPRDEVWKSKRDAQKKLDYALLASAFMPKPKEPRTYDEMMDYLGEY